MLDYDLVLVVIPPITEECLNQSAQNTSYNQQAPAIRYEMYHDGYK